MMDDAPVCGRELAAGTGNGGGGEAFETLSAFRTERYLDIRGASS